MTEKFDVFTNKWAHDVYLDKYSLDGRFKAVVV